MAPHENGWRDQAVFDADAEELSGVTGLIAEAGMAAAHPGGDHRALLGRLREALRVENDAEQGQQLLDAAALLAEADPRARGGLIALALEESRPVEVRRAALYLAAGDRTLLERIASDPAHELRTDAAAMLLEQDKAAGTLPGPRDTPPDEQ